MATIIPTDLITRLDACPAGHEGWAEWEQICTDILTFAFVPPLTSPAVQPRTYSGMDRRDVIYPNRNVSLDTIWGQLREELKARMILCEFKNYDLSAISKDEVDQTRLYLTGPMGKLAIMCCNKLPDEAAHRRRNQVYAQEQKVILFLLPHHLKELVYMRERGEDPGALIMDMVERFYMQHE